MDIEMISEDEFVSENESSDLKYKVKLVIKAAISLPKSFYFCLRTMPLKYAIKMPVLVAWNTELCKLKKNTVDFKVPVHSFMVKIGFGGSMGICSHKNTITLSGGKVIFGDHVSFSEGIMLRNSGVLEFGNNFFCNKNCLIWASKEIIFGDDDLLGWNVVVRDSDGHQVINNGIPGSVSKRIEVGKHTWICSEAHILKGAKVSDNSVLAYRSTLNKQFEQSESLLVGTPAKIIKTGINWNRG